MNLYGTLPTENGLLTSLQVFNMENNEMNGLLPTELCQLTNLQYLNLGRNNFYSRIPPCIGDKLTNLQSLYLDGNNLNDRLPTSMMKLKQLKHFVISDNLLTGDPIPLWNQLTSLEVLFADRNDFLSSVDVTFLWNCTNLRWIDVSDNNLQLANNHPFPRHLLQMSSLEVLDVSSNRLEGTIHSGLQSNTVLQYLSLTGNVLYGGLQELTNLRNLRHLDVSDNEFSGTIPSEFGSLSHLRLLFLGDNEYSIGQLPASFVNLTLLEDLSIRDGQLNGTFDLSSLPNSLIYLDLGSNTLTGGIPAEIGNLSNLEFFILNDNPGIIGALPTDIIQLTSLRAIFVDGTSLTSGVDQICTLPKFSAGGTNTTYDVVAYADCGPSNTQKDSDAEVACECCRCCSDFGNSGMGCSISYQINLRQDWSEDFQKLKFSVSNDTMFINRDNIPK
jgi:Leucine-rich repeat (LRR) protein